MRDITIAITAASYSGNKGAAAMLQSSIRQLYERYGDRLNINLMSVYPQEDREQIPYDFINVVPCKPAQLLFFAFPLAILYRLLRWCKPIAALLAKNKILRAYRDTDLVIDEAGISFVDSRGPVMNTYAFVCAAVPLLVGVPVVKYSQAMGPFHDPLNRFLAKLILPKLRLICARGGITFSNLKEIGITGNVALCADGAFSMEDNIQTKQEVQKCIAADPDFYSGKIVGLSLSSVVEKKCAKLGIDYKKTMIDFVDHLTADGYQVLLIANAARIHSIKPRNNDLMVCDAVYSQIADKEMVRWYHKEMTAEEIREYISCCYLLVASRFHAMVGGLAKQIPVLLVGWSHKYLEVLDMFELGPYAIDFSRLDLESLKEGFAQLVAEKSIVEEKLVQHIDTVQSSSRQNIVKICAVLDEVLKNQKRQGLFDYRDPDRYMGTHILCRKGYASREGIRANAASGGMITALLCDMLKAKEIDGAWVSRSVIRDGKLDYKTFIATTEEELMDASSSIYMEMPLLKHLDMLRQFQGKVAVVFTPCIMMAFQSILDKDPELAEKVVLKIGLFCSGNYTKQATALPLEKLQIPLEKAQRLYYRCGHWRGNSTVIYQDGSQKVFSYSKTICAYKNAYFYTKQRCLSCQDHFARQADISFGDIWLKAMKKQPIKHTCCIIRTGQAKRFYQNAVARGTIIDSHISRKDVIKGQKRALVFKYHCAGAKHRVDLDTRDSCRWNHKLAFFLAEKNQRISQKYEGVLRKIPMWMIYYYMCFIRALLSF